MSKQSSSTTTALVLDDDADTRFAIGRILGKCGCAVLEAETMDEAVALIDANHVDITFSDMRIPSGPGGEELLEYLQEKQLDIYLVLMSCAMDDASRARLLEKGAFECLQKPFFRDSFEDILSRISDPIKKSA